MRRPSIETEDQRLRAGLSKAGKLFFDIMEEEIFTKDPNKVLKQKYEKNREYRKSQII